MSEMPELLPCPFCGKAAVFIPEDDHQRGIIRDDTGAAGCFDCDMFFGWMPNAEAVAAWNRRTETGGE